MTPVLDAILPTVEAMDDTLHDLGQPLTSIALAMELLAVEEDHEQRRHLLQVARGECSRAQHDVAELRQKTSNLLHLAAHSGKA